MLQPRGRVRSMRLHACCVHHLLFLLIRLPLLVEHAEQTKMHLLGHNLLMLLVLTNAMLSLPTACQQKCLLCHRRQLTKQLLQTPLSCCHQT